VKSKRSDRKSGFPRREKSSERMSMRGSSSRTVLALCAGCGSPRVKSHACRPAPILLLSVPEPDAAAIRVLVSQ